MRRMESDVRIAGVVVDVHGSQNKYGGTFGEIAGDDGKHYVWSSSNAFRDFTEMRVGQRVTFRLVEYSYATDITSKGQPNHSVRDPKLSTQRGNSLLK